MNQQIDKWNSYDQVAINMPQDQNSWFGKQPQRQNVQNAWWRWLWQLTDHPEKPKHGDGYYHLPTREIVVHNVTKPTYNTLDTSNVFAYAPELRYLTWEYTLFLWLVYEATQDYPNASPNTLLWRKPVNILDQKLTTNKIFARSVLRFNKSIPPNTPTSLINGNVNLLTTNSFKILPPTPPFWRNGIYIPEDGYYQIHGNILRWSISWEAEKAVWLILIDWPTWSTAQLTYASQKRPTVMATSITTGTDSLWWAITATTTTTIEVWDTLDTNLSLSYYWYFKEWNYIDLQAFQDGLITVDALAWTIVNNTNADWTYLYLYRVS